MKKRITALALALLMSLALLPTPAAQAIDRKLVLPRTLLKEVYFDGGLWEYASPISVKASPHPYEYFTDKNGNIGIFNHKFDNTQVVYILSKDFQLLSKQVITLPAYDEYGCFLYGDDGNYYIAVGYDNPSEDRNKVGVQIHQVSPDTGKVIKTVSLKADGFGYTLRTIKYPFQATADMVQRGNKIYLYMSQIFFKSSDGLNHQGANMVVADFNSMTFGPGSLDFYVSHSFNQIVEKDGDNLVVVSQGDGFPRAMRLTVQKSSGETQRADFLHMNGRVGENPTGATVNGVAFSDSHYFVVGNSVTNGHPVNGEESYPSERDKGRNVYLEIIDKASMTPKHVWLTEISPFDKENEVGEPKIVRLSKDQFVVLFSVKTKDGGYLEYRLLDGSGKIIKQTRIEGSYFQAPVAPYLRDGRLYWISPWISTPEEDRVGTGASLRQYSYGMKGWVYFFEMDVSDPQNPKMVQGIRPERLIVEPASRNVNLGDGIQLTARIEPSNSPFTMIKWGRYDNNITVTKEGFMTAIRHNSTGEVMASSVVDPTVNGKGTINVMEIPRIFGKVRPHNIPGQADPQPSEVYGGIYQYFVLDKGKTTRDPGIARMDYSRPEYTAVSSDPSVVEVRDGAELYGKAVGTATITYRTTDDYFASCEVEVINPWKPGLTITQLPKTTYEIGEPFDTSGFEAELVNDVRRAVIGEKQTIFTIPTLVNKLWTDEQSNVWGRGRPFTKTGTYEVKVEPFEGGPGTSYTITVTGKEAPPPPVMEQKNDTLPPPVDADGNKAPATPITPPTTPTTPTQPAQTSTAVPSATKLMVDGKAVAADAYLINENNYIKLRDLATMVNGTGKNFEVTWDGAKNAINLKTKSPYTAVGGELAKGDGKSATATLTTSAIYVNGVQQQLTAYLIGQNNYFKLRDVMQVMDVNVGWDQASGTATLNTAQSYEVPGGTTTPTAPTEPTTSTDEEGLAAGVYKIRPAGNLEQDVCISGASKNGNAELILWKTGAGGHREFQLDATDGGYTMTLVHSGWKVTADGKKGGVLTQSAGSTFLFLPQSDGSYRIQDKASGLYMGVSGGVLENSSKLILWSEESDGSQTFVLEKLR